ncbi:hypothetical protein A2U01_0058960, partial [Trifolium medium]|nr:hypothetical protein [Trifolium medium]
MHSSFDKTGLKLKKSGLRLGHSK